MLKEYYIHAEDARSSQPKGNAHTPKRGVDSNHWAIGGLNRKRFLRHLTLSRDLAESLPNVPARNTRNSITFCRCWKEHKVQTVWIVVDAQQVSNPSNVCFIISVDCHALAVELAGEEGVNMSSANQNTRECVVWIRKSSPVGVCVSTCDLFACLCESVLQRWVVLWLYARTCTRLFSPHVDLQNRDQHAIRLNGSNCGQVVGRRCWVRV